MYIKSRYFDVKFLRKNFVSSEIMTTFAPQFRNEALKQAPLAQLVEHLTLNQGVQSSSL